MRQSAELPLEQPHLEQPDAVLAGDRAAELEADLHDLVERLAAPRDLVGVAGRRRPPSGGSCRPRRDRRSPMMSPHSALTCSTRSTRSASRSRGTQTSSIIVVPELLHRGEHPAPAWPAAALPRPGRRPTAISIAPASSRTFAIVAISSAARSPPASDWASISAPASGAIPMLNASLTAWTVTRSMNSSRDGMTPHWHDVRDSLGGGGGRVVDGDDGQRLLRPPAAAST